MPYFDRFDICEAYAILEYDYNMGGILQERPRNQRGDGRKMSVGFQLHRMQFSPGAAFGYRFSDLTENGQEIYREAVERMQLPKCDDECCADEVAP